MKGIGAQMVAILAGALLGVVGALYIVYMSEETRILETSADDMNLVDLMYMGRNAQRYAELSQESWAQEAAKNILRRGGLGGCGLISIGERDFIGIPCEEQDDDYTTAFFVHQIAINELGRYSGAWRVNLALNENILTISREITSEHHISAKFNFSLLLPELDWSELEGLIDSVDELVDERCIDQTNYRIFNGTAVYQEQDVWVRQITETGEC
ncbi:MAG: hypothetical protein GOU99_00810 [Candidatus Altiarchaeota archaeon]|nr:hypothetical protein [Candidatus Altiarchaeota archaeon]